MNISEFLIGEDLTKYANKRFEKVNENITGKVKLLIKLLLPLVFVIVLDKATGTSLLSTSIITILSLVYLVVTVVFAKTEFRKLNKKDKVNQYELEELAKENVNLEFLHDTIPNKLKEVERFETTLKTISLYRENVSCEKANLNLESLIVFDGHKVFTNIVFTDKDTEEQFLVGILFNVAGNAEYYSEYPIVNGVLDQTNVVLKTVENTKKSINIKH